jgi:RNA polymerase sigma-70 factor (ECF subfamily)
LANMVGTVSIQMPRDADLEFVRRVKRGEIDAFEILIRKYERRLFVFARNLLKTSDQVEDLVQEVFLAAYRNLHSFDPELGLFSTWLMRIARNKCLNESKKKKGMPLADVPEMPGKENPEADLMRKEAFRRLDQALQMLSFRQRIVFVLAEIQGFSHEAIAGIEKTKIGTVKSRLSRAKEHLRSILKDLER